MNTFLCSPIGRRRLDGRSMLSGFLLHTMYIQLKDSSKDGYEPQPLTLAKSTVVISTLTLSR